VVRSCDEVVIVIFFILDKEQQVFLMSLCAPFRSHDADWHSAKLSFIEPLLLTNKFWFSTGQLCNLLHWI
jgi:hypothetical protein